VNIPELPTGHRPTYLVGARRVEDGWDLRVNNWGTLHSATLDDAERVVREDVAARSRWAADELDVVISTCSAAAPDRLSVEGVPPLRALRDLLEPHADVEYFDLLIDVAIADALETGSLWKLRNEFESWLRAGLLAANLGEMSGMDMAERTDALQVKGAEWVAGHGDAWTRLREFVKSAAEQRGTGAQ
jgi:hypothetical protein